MPFTTQHGNQAVRVMNGMPQTDKGFKVYNDDGTVFADYSGFIYSYGEGAYTTVQETIQPAECSYADLPASAFDRLSSRVSRLSTQVKDITPYTETKQAYIGNTECIFNVSVPGEITAFVTDIYGKNIPNIVQRNAENIVVEFEALEDLATVTISIQ